MRALSLLFGPKKHPVQHNNQNEKPKAIDRSPRPTFSPSEDDQYRTAECERTRVFLLAEQRRETDFLEAEAKRREPEDARNGEFIRFLSDDTKSFWENQKARQAAFIEEETKQEGVFKEKEGARNSAFEDAQVKREEVAKSSQERRLKRAKWYSVQREEVRSKGRSKRDKLFEALVRDLQCQFDEFLKAEVESLIQLQEHRKENPETNGHSSPADVGVQPVLQEEFYLRRRSVSSSCVIATFPPPNGEKVLQRWGSSRSSFVSIPPSPHIAMQCPMPSEPPFIISVDDEPIPNSPKQSPKEPPTYNESDFQLKQEERERIFKEGQQIRENNFKEGEAKRQSGYHTRQKDFEKHVEWQKDDIRRAQVAFQGSFNHLQRSRDQGASIRRGYFDAFLLQVQRVFEQDILWFTERHRAEEEFASASRIVQENQMTTLLANMQEKIRDTLMNLAGVVPEDEDVPAIVMHARARSRSSIGENDPVVPCPPPAQLTTCRIASSRSRSRSPYRERIIFDLVPESLFVPQTLFQQAMGMALTTTLPIPVQEGVKYKTEFSSISPSKKLQIQFEAAERQRKISYQFEVEQYQYQFTVSEHRRQIQFLEQIRQFSSLVDKQESEWNREFMASQESRRYRFYDSERARVQNEVEAVVEREKRFAVAQEKRTKAFHDLQEDLQERCIEAECQAQYVFEGLVLEWRRKMAEKLEKWKDWFHNAAGSV